MAHSRRSVLYAAYDCKIKKVLTDPAPTVTALSAVSNVTTTVTATVASASGLTVGQTIDVSGITGFTTNNPNGRSTIATIAGTTITYVVALAPTGAYTSGGSLSAVNPITYGPLVQVDAIKTLAITPGFKSDVLRGAMQIRDSRAVQTDIKWVATHGALNLDQEVVLFGGTVVDSGSDPSQVTTLTQRGSDRMNYFGLEAQCIGVDDIVGDAHFVFPKCHADADSIGLADETHHIFSFGGSALPTLSDNVWRQVVLNQLQQAIAA